MNALACAISDAIARLSGSVWAVYIAMAVCALAWFLAPPTDPFNSLVSDVSLILLFVLQRSGNRDTQALKAASKELVKAVPGADEGVIERAG